MTESQKDLFLVELAFSGNISFALAAAGISREEALKARLDDPEFEQEWRAAEGRARRAFSRRIA